MKTLIVLRRDNISISRVTGDVIDILPADRFVGIQVDKFDSEYALVTVTDLSETLEGDFKNGAKRLVEPAEGDPLHNLLLPNDTSAAHITVDELLLMDYVTGVNNA